jgi:hypothetical protein
MPQDLQDQEFNILFIMYVIYEIYFQYSCDKGLRMACREKNVVRLLFMQ